MTSPTLNDRSREINSLVQLLDDLNILWGSDESANAIRLPFGEWPNQAVVIQEMRNAITHWRTICFDERRSTFIYTTSAVALRSALEWLLMYSARAKQSELLSGEDLHAIAEQVAQRVYSISTLATSLESAVGAEDARMSVGLILDQGEDARNRWERIEADLKGELNSITDAKIRFSEYEAGSAKHEKEILDRRSSYDDLVARYLKAEPLLNRALATANKVGLAGAFEARRNEIGESKTRWGWLFSAGLVFLTLVEIVLSLQTIQLWEAVLVRFAVGAPFIWAAWFAARQYGYMSRLQEDYAFKVATAMSFEGYKKEATDISDAMLEMLMSSSIKTFSDNPLRIYNLPTDAATPIQAVSEEVSKNSKLLDQISALLGRAK